MSQTWSFAGRSYTEVAPVAQDAKTGVGWHIVRHETDSVRYLLQLWSPRPSDRDLDRIKHAYLQRFSDAPPEDPGEGHFGFSETQAWFLQRLGGTPLAELWPEFNPTQRNALLEILGTKQRPQILRVYAPEVVGLLNGRILIPRALGSAPQNLEAFTETLHTIPFAGHHPQPSPWDTAPELSQAGAHPIRGRQQEMTYLKTLTYGLTAPVPMERLFVLHGEAGLGLGTLARWAAATAESEGVWVTRLKVMVEEPAGMLLGRLLTDLLVGLEAEFYAAFPEAARRLSRRVTSFSFLRGGRKLAEESARIEADEIQAAHAALDFAHKHRPRLLQVLDLQAANPETLQLLSELAIGGKEPWFFSYGTTAPSPELKTFLTSLQQGPHLAIIQLTRMEDSDLRVLVDDLLGCHQVPEATLQGLCHSSLGNPGLLASMLERAQQDGNLQWRHHCWEWKAGAAPNLDVHENLVNQILEGRLRRLKAPTLAIMRALALVDGPLTADVLGRAVGLAGDPFEDAISSALSFKLVSFKDGQVLLRDPVLRELVLDQAPQGEVRRLAKALLKALEDGPKVPLPPVRLISLAMDEATALSHVLQAIDQLAPSPKDAERVVHQSMRLNPTSRQRARLWEYLADAWAAGTSRARVPLTGYVDLSPWELSLEALGLAVEALKEDPDPEDRSFTDGFARVMRKRALLEIRLGRSVEAQRSILSAAECLSEHPLHPEHPRLRCVLGKIHALEGFTNKAVRAFEEGLQLVGSAEQRSARLDQITLQLELGRVIAQRAQFRRALGTLQSAQRMLEHEEEPRLMVQVLVALAHIHLAMGHPDLAYGLLREGLQGARIQDDLELSGLVHFTIGMFRCLEQSMDTAITHLDKAYGTFQRLGDRPAMSRTELWKARTIAGLGDTVQGDLAMLRALSQAGPSLTAVDRGDRLFLQADIAAFGHSWRDAARLYGQAADIFESSGLLWRERLAKLRQIQALAREGGGGTAETLRDAWNLLEALKIPAESGESRWLELEWHRAHALLLANLEGSETVVTESLGAWNMVLAAARDMHFHGVIIMACVESGEVLLRLGERLGARSRLQEAQTSFQMLWSRVPEAYSMSFQGRPDIHRYQEMCEKVGLGFSLPERSDPLSDWTPTQTHYRLGVQG